MGKPFAAGMQARRRTAPEFDFGQARREDEEAPDFSGQEPLGRLPEVRRPRLRARHGLRLREGGRTGAHAAISARGA